MFHYNLIIELHHLAYLVFFFVFLIQQVLGDSSCDLDEHNVRQTTEAIKFCQSVLMINAVICRSLVKLAN